MAEQETQFIKQQAQDQALKPTQFNAKFEQQLGRAPTSAESGLFIQEQSLAFSPERKTVGDKPTPTDARTEVVPPKAEEFGMMRKEKPAVPGGEKEEAVETDVQRQLREASELAQRETDAHVRVLDEARERFQALAAAEIQDIKTSYAARIRDMEQVNRVRQEGLEALGFRTGRARYAPEVQSGILSAEETAGLARINSLNREMNSLIRQAQAAAADKDFALLDKRMGLLKQKRDEQRQNIMDLHKITMDEESAAVSRARLQLDIDKAQKDITGKQKMFTVAPGSSVYDPETNTFRQAPQPDDIGAPEISTFNGKVHQWNPTTRSWKELGDEEVGFDISDPQTAQEVMDWANAIQKGTAKLEQIKDEELRSQVVGALNKMPPKQEDITEIQNKIDTLDELLEHRGKAGVVGARKLARWTPAKIDKEDKIDFIGKVQRILSKETLKSLQDAKAKGATFGALSDAELQILSEAASSIGFWATDDDGDGKVDFYEIGEKQFDAEIKRIKGEYEKALKETAGENVPTRSMDQILQTYYVDNPDKREGLEKIRQMLEQDNQFTNKPFTEQEKREVYEKYGVSFPKDLSMSLKGSVEKIASAIGQFESGGNYQAMGPVTKKGDRAYGKYQIMGNNIPSWSKEALGRSVSTEEFLSSPGLQDKIALHKMKQYHDKYGTVEDVASLWFSGRTFANAGNRKDILGTTVPQYVRNIKNNLS